MKRLGWVAAVLLGPLAGAAQAAEPTPGGKACGKLISDAQTVCASALDAQANLKKLKEELAALQDAAAQEAKQVEIATLQQTLAELQADPLAELCGGIKGVVAAPTCDRLASLLSADQADADAVAEAKKKAKAELNLAKQSDRQTATNKSGSAAQSDPVESIQPITMAGGALALSGTRSGTKGVGTITVNPLALSKPDDATLGRIFDLSVSAPFDLDNGAARDRRYVSARLRVNATAPISAKRLNAVLQEFAVAEGKFADDLQGVLERAPNVRKCAASIIKTSKVTKEACGETLEGEYVRKLHTLAYGAVAEARREADKYYLGLDVRFDTGDPSGPDVVGDKGTHLLGGGAAGIRLEAGSLWDWELRGRAGGDYFKSRDDVAGPNPEPVFSFDWGAAIILSGRPEPEAKQRLAFGVGIEGRHAGGGVKKTLAPTNYANLNLMAVVPAATGGDLGLAFSIPVADSAVPRGILISFSTDLGMLDRPSQ